MQFVELHPNAIYTNKFLLGAVHRTASITVLKGMYDPTCVPHFDSIELSEDSIRTEGNKYICG